MKRRPYIPNVPLTAKLSQPIPDRSRPVPESDLVNEIREAELAYRVEVRLAARGRNVRGDRSLLAL